MNRIIIFCFLIIISCSPEENDATDDYNSVSILKYSLYEKYGDEGLLFTREYSINEDGKVMYETINDYIPTTATSFSAFEYDNQGRIIKQKTDGLVSRTVKWTGEKAEVYNGSDQKMSEFIFSGDKLLESRTGFIDGAIRYLKYNYDSNGNIKGIEDEAGPKYEYLDYDTSTLYPLYLTRSMGILRMQNRPFFKNNFAIKKVYPFQADDYFSPLTLYNFTYTYYSDNKLKSINDEESAYVSKFSYD